jgi:hypothetical protein
VRRGDYDTYTALRAIPSEESNRGVSSVDDYFMTVA